MEYLPKYEAERRKEKEDQAQLLAQQQHGVQQQLQHSTQQQEVEAQLQTQEERQLLPGQLEVSKFRIMVIGRLYRVGQKSQ